MPVDEMKLMRELVLLRLWLEKIETHLAALVKAQAG